jgi:hypothetical protein
VRPIEKHGFLRICSGKVDVVLTQETHMFEDETIQGAIECSGQVQVIGVRENQILRELQYYSVNMLMCWYNKKLTVEMGVVCV